MFSPLFESIPGFVPRLVAEPLGTGHCVCPTAFSLFVALLRFSLVDDVAAFLQEGVEGCKDEHRVHVSIETAVVTTLESKKEQQVLGHLEVKVAGNEHASHFVRLPWCEL